MKRAVNSYAKIATMLAVSLGAFGCSIGGGASTADGMAVISTACFMDGINGQTTDSVEVPVGPITVTGWSADSTTGLSPEKLAVQILDVTGNAVLSGLAKQRISRPDVAKAYNQPGYEKSGFEASLDVKTLQPGSYGLSTVMVRADGVSVCQSNKKLILK